MVKFFVKKSAAVFSFSVMIIIIGIISYFELPRESFPEIKQPMIFVTTTYPGVSAKDIENLVTRILEEEIEGLEGLDKLSSSSQQSLSFVYVEFTSDITTETALRRVRERVDIAKSKLPEDAEEPVLSELSSSNWPFFTLVMSHSDGLETIDKSAEFLEEELGRVKGVLDVQVAGRMEKEVLIEIDPLKLEKYEFTLDNVIEAVQSENVSIPGGILSNVAKDYTLAVTGEIKNPKQFEEVLVSAHDVSVPLKELGTAIFTWKEPETYSRLNGSPCISISLTKRTGSNIIKIVEKANKVIEKLKPSLPYGTKLEVSLDMSKDVKEMIIDLENNIFSALVLVLIVTIFFIGPINSLFVSMAIPFSMLMSFFILQCYGITLNMIVLFSLVLALGMLVDNGIVIVENIFRHASMGKSRVKAAIEGSQEVAGPIIASTITTCLAFLPIIFMPGIMGDIMSFLPKTVIIVLTCSLIVALTINPVFCATYMKISEKNMKKIMEGSGAFLAFQNWYGRRLEWAVKHPVFVIFFCFIVVVSGFVLYGMYGKEQVFFPNLDPRSGVVVIETPQGTPLEITDNIVKKIEKTIPSSPASLDNYLALTGKGPNDDMFGSIGTEASKATIQINYKTYLEREIAGDVAVDSLKQRLRNFTGADIVVRAINDGPPTGHDISYQVIGNDYGILGSYSDSLLAILNRYSKFKVVDCDYESAKPEIEVSIDREKAAYHGLSTSQVASAIRNSINGVKIGKFRKDEDEYDITVRYKENFRNSIYNLQNIIIVNNDDERIPLASIARVKSRSSIGVIKRKDVQRAVEVWADFKEDVQTKNTIKAEIIVAISKIQMPEGYYIQSGEGFAMREEATKYLQKAFLIALFLIVIVLIIQFNSITEPFIMIVTVLFSFSGVFWGYLIIGQQFIIIMSGIGLIALMGVVVNNCIVLIDYTNILKKQGMDYKDAIINAGKTRLRPVLLTAITTILGMLPMAIGFCFDVHKFTLQIGSESGQWWVAFAWAMIFGLSFATVMTLIMVPCMLTLNFRFFPPKEIKFD